MVARRTKSLLVLLTTALLCTVDAYRKLRTSSSANIIKEERRTNDGEEKEVLSSQENQKQKRDLWGREYSFGAVLDGQRPRGTLHDKGQNPNRDMPLLGDLPSDGIRPNSLTGNVVPIGSASDSGNTDFQPRPRIVGGSDDADLAPFAMQLTYDGTDQSWVFAGCSATLISNCHVLTAAHCVLGLRDILSGGVRECVETLR
jgi:Trypsin